MSKNVFITGGTGYLGRRLISLLLQSGYQVKALAREGSEQKLPGGCTPITGNPFDTSTFVNSIDQGSTFVQLLGVSHPGPSKKDLFYKIDFASVAASVAAAKQAEVAHFVYVSVAQTPTSVMQDYQNCRAKCEALIKDSGLKTSIIRPWYVVGPGHYWPLLFLPFFKVLEIIPQTSAKAKALRLVYLTQMLDTLVYAIVNPPNDLGIFEIEQIRMMRTNQVLRP
jgi:uncharacterized protein YbjT (DUF2867 family)